MSELAIFIIYLFYGAAFFAIGVAIVARLKTFSTLRIAGLFWLLAVFAFTHCFHEWLELFLHLNLGTDELWLQLRHLSLFLMLISFLVLFFFGINLHGVLNVKTWPYLAAWMVLCAAGFVFVHVFFAQPLLLADIDYNIRRFFALPATLLTGAGFILYGRRLQTFSARGAVGFTGAGLAFFAYGILTGLVPSTAVIIGLPVQFWRGFAAFVILHFIMLALDRFLAERDALISRRLQDAAHLEKLGAVGRLAAGIAHEINNPLTNVSLQLELLKADPALVDLAPKSRERLQIAERNLEKGAKIARELLFLAGRGEDRQEQGEGRQGREEMTAVDLNRTITETWGNVAARNPRCRLRNRLPASLVLPGSPLKLEQLFANLFSNALDAMPEGGDVEVSGWRRGRKTIITVSDQGGGVIPENRSRVLEPFFTTKEIGLGTGLGLAICYGIMLQHGGEIEITAPDDDLGTKVILTFRDLKGRKEDGTDSGGG